MANINRRQFLGMVGAAAATTTVAKAAFAQDKKDKYGAAILAEPGLRGYWRLDGDLLDSKGTRNGEAKKGAVSFIAGPLGRKAAAFDGKALVSMGPTPELDLVDETIEFFFMLPTAPPADHNPCLIAKRSSSPETRFSLHVQNDLAKLLLWNGWGVAPIALPDGPVQVGRWYHLALVDKGSGSNCFVDGVECEVAMTVPFNYDKKGLPLVLGASSEEGTEACNCALAEVAVYAGALSAKQIAAHIAAAGMAETSRALAEKKQRADAEKARAKAEKTAKRLHDPRLFARGTQRIYEGEHLDAIAFAVGGIGAGLIQMNGRAERSVWQIFNNFSQAVVPDSFMAIRAGGVVRALQTSSVGPFTKMKALRFRGEYPFAWYDFVDSELPVKVGLEVFSPMVPLDAKASAIPCAVFSVTVENPTGKEIEIEVLAAQQNAVGFTGNDTILGRKCKAYGGNRNEIVLSGGFAALHMTSDLASDAPGYGDMVLGTTGDALGAASWSGSRDLFDSFGVGDFQAGPSPAGETLNGALVVKRMLKPKQRETVTYALTWHFPNVTHGGVDGWSYAGNMYAGWWKNALEVARFLGENGAALREQTVRFHDTLYGGNLPRRLIDRMTGQMAILRNKTCFWAKNGYFGAWEGCAQDGGCCHGSCTHVWHYAQGHARLFPELARIMREATYGFQKPDGSLPHRHPNYPPATDGQLGDILGAYREHLCSSDGAWLQKLWPKVRKALDATIESWDKEEKGVLAGAQWNTLDGALGGSTSWIGTLYLAALAACEKMAVLQGDRAAAQRYAKIRVAGAARQNETLWNGEYYMQIPDPEPRSDYDDGCAIDQLLGEWWGDQLDIAPHYPLDRIRKALDSLIKYNFQPDFHGVVQAPRRFVVDDDPGMQMIKWPHGPRPVPTISYGDEVMSGFEYAAAAAMVQFGMLREGYMVVFAASDRYDGKLRHGLTYGWDTSGNPFGDDECGKYYARAMSAWSLLLASQGFIYDGPAGVIGFRPVWRPEDHRSFWTGAEGWGSFAQKRSGDTQKETIDIAWGRLRVRSLVFASPEGKKAWSVRVSIGGNAQACTFDAVGDRLTVSLATESVIGAGSRVEAEISFV